MGQPRNGIRPKSLATRQETNRIASRSKRKRKIRIIESKILFRSDSARILVLRKVSTRRFYSLRNSRIFSNLNCMDKSNLREKL